MPQGGGDHSSDFWTAYSYCLGLGYDFMGNHGAGVESLEKGVAIEPGPISKALLGSGTGGWEIESRRAKSSSS